MPTTAAAVSFQEIAPAHPSWSALKADPGVGLSFLGIDTLDGNRVDAACWQPEAAEPANTVLIIAVHGSGGNFTRKPCSTVGSGLSAAGHAVLAINTRQHDAQVNSDNFFDVAQDIEAAVYTGRALGYRKIVLLGHSLGSIQCQFYAATHWNQGVKGVILTGMFGNLPWKSRHLLIQDQTRYRLLADSAREAVHHGDSTVPLADAMPSHSGAPSAVTAQHFLTYRDEEVSAAVGPYWIKRIPVPILMVRDEADLVIQPFEPQMLMGAAQEPDALPPEVRYVVLPNPAERSLEAHGFADTGPQLVAILCAWLGELGTE
jgi:pimeloyl-ACP methyl ester carboxylesterase